MWPQLSHWRESYPTSPCLEVVQPASSFSTFTLYRCVLHPQWWHCIYCLPQSPTYTCCAGCSVHALPAATSSLCVITRHSPNTLLHHTGFPPQFTQLQHFQNNSSVTGFKPAHDTLLCDINPLIFPMSVSCLGHATSPFPQQDWQEPQPIPRMLLLQTNSCLHCVSTSLPTAAKQV